MRMRSRMSCLVTAAAAIAAAWASPAAAVDGILARASASQTVGSWTGFYIGAHGGWGWATSEWTDPVIFNPTFDPNEASFNGPLAGGQLGANKQIGNLVFGAEIDGDWSFVRGNSNRDQTIVSSSANNAIQFRAFATATGRIGYAMGPWLAYVKAGGAWADMRLLAPIQAQPLLYHRQPFGATGGAGMEVALMRNVSAKVEYNLLYFPHEQFPFVYYQSDATLNHLVQVVKAGINLHFGGDALPAR